MKSFDKSELIQIDGANIEKEFAVPNLTGEQNAIMLQLNSEGRWELSGWGAVIDGSGTVACGWEPLNIGDLDTILEYTRELANAIETME